MAALMVGITIASVGCAYALHKIFNPEVRHSVLEVTTPPCGMWESFSDSLVGGSGSLNALFAESDDDVWAVGSSKDRPFSLGAPKVHIQHWDGRTWEIKADIDLEGDEIGLNDVAGTSSADIWAVGYVDHKTLVLHWNGEKWETIQSPSPGAKSSTLNGVLALAADDAWAVGSYQDSAHQTFPLILRWNGAQWNSISRPVNTRPNQELYAIAAASINDIWAVGGTLASRGGTSKALILHWDGSQWSTLQTPEVCKLQGVAVALRDDVWAVGGCGAPSILHWDGRSWKAVSTSSITPQGYSTLTGVVALSHSDVWAAGPHYLSDTLKPLVAHWDGKSWTTFPSPHHLEEQLILDIVAAPSSTIWLAGRSRDGEMSTNFAFTSKFTYTSCSSEEPDTPP
jgi:hypothetical protein